MPTVTASRHQCYGPRRRQHRGTRPVSREHSSFDRYQSGLSRRDVCSDEDLLLRMTERGYRNGVLDPGEDFNGSTRRLEAGNIALVTPSNVVTTDARIGLRSSMSSIRRNHAYWVMVDAEARRRPCRARNIAVFTFLLPGSAETSMTRGHRAAGVMSPFGIERLPNPQLSVTDLSGPKRPPSGGRFVWAARPVCSPASCSASATSSSSAPWAPARPPWASTWPACSAVPFYDSDAEIERRTGVDIPFIFEKEGEAGFREREREAIDALTASSRIVLATGGGAVLRPENRRCLAERGCVVYLRDFRRAAGQPRPPRPEPAAAAQRGSAR